jgi:hypothetical protein
MRQKVWAQNLVFHFLLLCWLPLCWVSLCEVSRFLSVFLVLYVYCYAECCYAEKHILLLLCRLFCVLLCWVILSLCWLSLFCMLSVAFYVMPCVIMLDAAMLNVVMLSIIHVYCHAMCHYFKCRYADYHYSVCKVSHYQICILYAECSIFCYVVLGVVLINVV